MTIVLIILGITIVLFVWGKYPPDVVALISMLALFLTNVLNLSESLSGFSNPTVIMIAALFIIGEGLSRTGWTALAGRKFVKLAGKSYKKLLTVTTLGSSVLSGFVSNTGTVAALMPMTVSAAWKAASLPSKLLIPVAFSSNIGGLLTLTGTPPNIIVSNVLSEDGTLGFAFFEFSLIGLPLLIISILYFRYLGHRFLPNNESEEQPANIDSKMHKWIEDYKVGENLYRLRIRSMSPLINTKIKDWNLQENDHLSIVRLRRRSFNTLNDKKRFVELPDPSTVLRYHDIITVKGETDEVDRFIFKFKLGLVPGKSDQKILKEELVNQEIGMAELIVTPGSMFVGQKIPLGDYLDHEEVQLLAASRGNKPFKGKEITVEAGDAFVVRGAWNKIELLEKKYENLVIVGSPEAMSKDVDIIDFKSYIALGSLILMIILLVFDVFPGAITTLICAGIVMLSGCVPISKAYKGISWRSVIMIAAMIPMGIALEKTGVAQLAATGLVDSLGAIHPTVLLGGIFLLTTSFSQAINNSATTVLMAPIALMAAKTLGISPEAFLIVVAVSASTAFLTPVGTTTNAMVMAAGNYKFVDYLKVGAPLLLLIFIATVLLVPLIWTY